MGKKEGGGRGGEGERSTGDVKIIQGFQKAGVAGKGNSFCLVLRDIEIIMLVDTVGSHVSVPSSRGDSDVKGEGIVTS